MTNVLIMVDEEGDGCMPTKEGRRQFDINHRKWIDAAYFLGCTPSGPIAAGLKMLTKRKP